MKYQFRTTLICFLLSSGATLTAQDLYLAPATGLSIKAGTDFHVGGLTLLPSQDFTLSANQSMAPTVFHFTQNPSIARVYRFDGLSEPFSGSISIKYEDGELNGLSKQSLVLDVHDGTRWQSFGSAVNDESNNLVQSNLLSGVQLAELTLSSANRTLPLTWTSFSAQKQGMAALLKWNAANEQSTRYFVVQHRNSNGNWTSIGHVNAGENKSPEGQYTFLHPAPPLGSNFYRVMAKDKNDRWSYSVVARLDWAGSVPAFRVLQNPAVQSRLSVEMTAAMPLALVDGSGHVVHQLKGLQGQHTYSLPPLAKGAYWVVSQGYSQKVMVQ